MRKRIALALISCLLIGLFGCAPAAQDTTLSSSESTQSVSSNTGTSEGPDGLFVTEELNFTALAGQVGYFDRDSELYKNSIAGTKLPLYCITSLSQMQDFIGTYFPVATLQYPSPLDPFLQCMTNAFFVDHFLLIIYAPAESSDFARGITSVIEQPYLNTIFVEVGLTDIPETAADDMSGWLLGACISKDHYSEETAYDAELLDS